jgi:small multidrug resistance pump
MPERRLTTARARLPAARIRTHRALEFRTFWLPRYFKAAPRQNVDAIERVNHYLYIGLAVGADAAAVVALKAADGFRVPLPSLLAMLGYGAAYFFLSQAVRTLPVGVANALWSGFSVIVVAMAGYVIHRQALSPSSISGLLLICGGTALLYFGSATDPS